MHARLADADTTPHPLAPTAVDATTRPPRLRVRFVGGRHSRVAEQAARCMAALARGRLDVEVAPGASGRATDPNASPSLVVVIHVAAEPAPLVADECGGRVDWHLGHEALTDDAAELMTRLRRHIARLLCDLGYPTSAFAVRPGTHPTGSVPRTPALLAAA